MADEDNFGAWMRNRLKSRALSQRQLAAKTGVHHSTISRLLRGDQHASLRTVLLVQAALAGDQVDGHVKGSDPLQPVALFRMLQSDGLLSDVEIGAIVRLYARLLADKPRGERVMPVRVAP
jgi:transcriptional regulator with XRE-family HTH domain